MKVSAVIPTVGRPELLRAVTSVLSQTYPVMPVVVLDRPELAEDVQRRLEGLRHKLILTAGAIGGAGARNIGVRFADSDVIAFLDDDDEWMPTKTESQLKVLESAPGAVISCRAILKGRKSHVVPAQPYSNEQSIADYLLERSTLKLKKNFIQSSTLLMSAELARRIPWRDELPRHQDWALLIELRSQNIDILTHADPLVTVFQGSNGSVSRSKNWRASEEWLKNYACDADLRVQADFLSAIALRSAIAAGDSTEARRLLARALRMRPHMAALAVGLSELVRRA